MANRSSSARWYSVLPRWLGQLFGRARRQPYRRPRPARLGLEQLETRLVLDSRTFAGLEFQTVDPNAAFTTTGNTVATTSAVEVGQAPATGSPFTALLRLDSGVTYDTTSTPSAFGTTGAVTSVASGQDVPLFTGGNHTFNANTLLTGGDNLSGDSNGQSVSVAGLNFTLASVQFAGNALELQGQLTVPKLAGLTIAVQGSDHVIIDSAHASTDHGVYVSGMDASLTDPQSFTAGGATLTVEKLSVHHTVATNELDISGTAKLTVASATAEVQLSGTDSQGHATPGIEIVGGSLTALTGTVTSPSITFVHGVLLQNLNLAVSYRQASTPAEVTVTGSATLALPDTSGASLNVKLGDADPNNPSQGIVYQDGKGLTKLDLSITSNSSFSTHGLTVAPESLHVGYQEDTGGDGRTHNTVTVSGQAAIGAGPLSNAVIALGDANTDGLVLQDGSLSELAATISGDVTVAGVAVHADNLGIAYNANANTFAITGEADFKVRDQQVGVTLGGPHSDGIVIQSGTLSSLEMGITTPDFDLLGLDIGAKNLTVIYVADDAQGNQAFGIYGDLTVTTKGGSGTLNGIEATLGDANQPGILVTCDPNQGASGTKLDGVNITLNGGFDLFGIGITPKNLSVKYDSAQDYLQITGGLVAEVTSQIRGEVELTDGGLTINTATHDVTLHGIDFVFDFDLGPFKVKDLHVGYSSEGGGGYSITASGEVDFPGGYGVNGDLTISDGRLISVGLGITGSIPIGDTGLFLNSLSGDLKNLDDPNNIKVNATVGVSLGKPITIPDPNNYFQPTEVAILSATGTITVSAYDLNLIGSVSLMGGILGSGSVTLDLNWASGVYEADVTNVSLYDGAFTFDGDLKFNTQGDVTFLGHADVHVPNGIPYIAGKQLGGLGFYLQVRPEGSTSDTFAAAWTDWTVPIINKTYTIGVKEDLGHNTSILDGGDVDDLESDARQPTTSAQPVGYYYTDFPFIPPARTMEAITFQVQSPALADPAFTADGTASLNVWAKTANSPNSFVPMNTLLKPGAPQSGNYLLAGGPVEHDPNGSVVTHADVRTIVINYSDFDSIADTPVAYEVRLTTKQLPAASVPKMTASFKFFDPTVSIAGITQPGDTETTFLLQASNNTIRPAATMASVYYDTDNKGYDGVLVGQMSYADLQANGFQLTWNGLPNLTLKQVYFYATINDTFNPIVYSTYTGPVTPPDPNPILTTPPSAVPVATGLVTEGAQPFPWEVTFPSAHNSGLVISTPLLLPTTVTLTCNKPCTFRFPGNPIDNVGSFSKTFASGADATAYLNGMVFILPSSFGGWADITLAVTTTLEGVDHTVSKVIPVAVPNAHLVVTQQADNPSPQEGDTVTFTVSVRNPGGPNGVNATDVAVNLTLPPQLTLTPAPGYTGTYDAVNHVWHLGNMSIGSTRRLVLSGVIAEGTGGTPFKIDSRVTSAEPIVYLSDATARTSVTPKAPLVVTTLADTIDPNDGVTSLREAILQANAAAGFDLITFGVTGTIDLTSSLPDLSDNVSIRGPEASALTIEPKPGQAFTLFNVAAGTRATLSGLTLEGGSSAAQGGAVQNHGNLGILRSVLKDNSAAQGGAIANWGALTVSDSTFEGNVSTAVPTVKLPPGLKPLGQASAANVGSQLLQDFSPFSVAPPPPAGGGAIYNAGLLEVDNSTFSGNEAVYLGGAVYLAAGNATFEDTTLAGNTFSASTGSGGGLYVAAGAKGTLTSTLVAGNGRAGSGSAILGESDVSGSVSGSANLIGANTNLRGLTNGVNMNQVGTAVHPVNPLLGPLQYNGGPTPTRALLAGSPAINAGAPTVYSSDQRGLPRPVGANDIGAFEVQPTPPPSQQTQPAAIAVTTLADIIDPNDGVTSLREAILQANTSPGFDLITFGVTGTLQLTSPLPDLIDSVTIRGPGASALTIEPAAGQAFRLFNVPAGIHLVLSGLTLAGGSAPQGGAIQNHGDLGIFRSVLKNNSAAQGGTIANWGSLTVGSSTFDEDTATATATVVNTSANPGGNGLRIVVSSAGGGAIYNAGLLAVSESTFSGNNAGDLGGAVYLAAGSASFADTTLAGNTFSEKVGSGGGLYVAAAPRAALTSTLVAGNGYAANGGAVSQGSDIVGTVSGAGNLVGVATGMRGLANGVNKNQVGTAAHPIQALLGPLQDNGGPTPTRALLPNSPALNAGVPTGYSTDQRGLPRPVGPNDVGAFEVQPNVPTGIGQVNPEAPSTTPSSGGTDGSAGQANDNSGSGGVTNFPLLPTEFLVVVGGPYTIQVGEGLTLSAEGTFDPTESFTYSWDVNGDGQFTDATGINPTLSWADLVALGIGTAGQYNVSVQVMDDQGVVMASAPVPLTVLNPAPAVAILNAPGTTGLGTAVTLTSGTDESVSTSFTYSWQVTRDGVAFASGSDATFTFTPDAADDYDVTLAVTDAAGATSTASTTITATDAPPPNASLQGPTAGTVGQDLTFTSSADPTLVTQSWEVRDSSDTVVATGSGNTFDFSQDATGTYQVSLTTTTASGTTVSKQTTQVTVTSAPPAVQFYGFTPQSPVGTLVTIFSKVNLPGGAAGFSYAWEVDRDGEEFATSTEPNLEFTPDAAGIYDVTLTLTDASGSSSTLHVVSITATGGTTQDNQAAPGDDTTTTTTTNTVAPPDATLQGPSAAVRGQTLNFSSGLDPSTVSPSNQSWEVRDSSDTVVATGSGETFSFTPQDTGSYQVSLGTANSDGSGASTQVIQVTVADPLPLVQFYGYAPTYSVGTLVTVFSKVDPSGDAGPFTYAWEVDRDGEEFATSTDLNLHFTPDTPGVYEVTLTLTDAAGNISGFHVDSITATSPAPQGVAVAGPSTVVVGQAVTYTGTYTDPGDSAQYTLGWEVYDLTGLVFTGTGPSATFTPMHSGTLLVQFTVTNGSGATAASSSAQATVSVTPATASVTVSGYSGTYDGGAHGLSGSATGAFAEDLSSLLTLGPSYTDAGHYVITWSFAGNSDYQSASGTTLVDIAQAPLTVTVGNVTRTYGQGADFSTLPATVATSIGTETLAVTYSSAGAAASADVVAGGYTLNATLASAGTGQLANYRVTVTPGILTVTPATAVVSVSGYSGTYDGAAHGLTGSATGVFAKDLSNLLQLGASYNAAGQHVVSWSFADNPDYFPAIGIATIDIFPAVLTVKANDALKTYGSANPAFTAGYSGFVAEEGPAILGGTLTFTTAATASSDVGHYAVTPGGLTAANYAIIYQASSLGVAPATLVVPVGSVTRTYGTANPPFAASILGVQNGDPLTASYSTAATTVSDVGSYAINATLSDGGTGKLAKDYVVVAIPGTLTVTPASAVVSVSGYSGTYDGAAHGLSGSATGAFGENLNNLLQMGASYSAAGHYVVNWSFAAGPDYYPNLGSEAITIAQATPTIVGSPFIATYDGQAHSPTAEVFGIGGVALGPALVIPTGYSVPVNAGLYLATASFTGNIDYAPLATSVSFTIARAPLTVRVNDATKAYGSANPAFVASYSGFVAGEGVAVLGGSLDFATAATASSEVGHYPVTPSGLTAANYAITYQAGTLGVIPVTLVVPVGSATRAYGAANPPFAGSILGVQNNDPLTASYSTAATAVSDVGSYAINATLSDGGTGKLAKDYVVVVFPGTLTVTPTATQTVLRASASSLLTTQVLTLTATVTSLSPLAAGTSVPSGSVTFRDGAATYTAPVNSSGVAIFPLPPLVLSAGTHSFTATYNGDGNFQMSPPSTVGIVQVLYPPSAVLSGDTGGVRGQSLNFTVTATDPAGGSAFAVTWGDGSSSPLSASAVGVVTTLGHVYSDSGAYSVRMTATTPSGQTTVLASQSVAVTGVALEADPDNASGSILAVGGTTGDDAILVAPAPGGGLTVTINGVAQRYAAPAGHAFSRILVFGQDGNDVLQVAKRVSVNAELHAGAGQDQLLGGGGDNLLLGGSGDDTLVGGSGQDILRGGSGNNLLEAGSGHDILVGGPGNDTLVGGGGRDLLIGGGGQDQLLGSGGDDLLIGGTTAYDANDAALLAILSEWASSQDYTTRVDSILGMTAQQGNSGFAARLNGNYFLNASTVQDDGATDSESGGGGQDWFFANIDASAAGHDLVLDATRKEVVTDIDPDA